MNHELPRILSPNLGCPIIISTNILNSDGFDIIMAESDDHSCEQLLLKAAPSCGGTGFDLMLSYQSELSEGKLPDAFRNIDDTRLLISTTLSSSIFAGKARFFRYKANPVAAIVVDMIRTVEDKGQPGVYRYRPTLYDLFLMKNQVCVSAVFHALCLRPKRNGLNFIHLTDLHVAVRNDLYADDVRYSASFFNNFNDNLRRFIKHANELADDGKLDFVLVLGDLVDFLHHGFSKRDDYGHNNVEMFRNIILGQGGEKIHPGEYKGLKVPIFTTTGNHDWRFFPYDAAIEHSTFGVSKEVAKEFDLYWADEQEEISQRFESIYDKLLHAYSPLSNQTKLGRLVNELLRWSLKLWYGGLQGLQKKQVRRLVPIILSALIGISTNIRPIGQFLCVKLGEYYSVLATAIALLFTSVLVSIFTRYTKCIVRNEIRDLLAIDAGWQALKDYFLTINPYFNYAFRVENNYFLIMETGHDCLRAEYLWDQGDEKLRSISIRDNILGNSPDVMAFYDANEYYPYNQINWIDRLMQLIEKEAKKAKEAKTANEETRIFVGVHAPPANLSKKARKKAYRSASDPDGLYLCRRHYNIRFGTINHYLSQFFHLCLGRIEDNPGEEPPYIPVDMVLAGHAHWKLELRLDWNKETKNPDVYYGDFTNREDFSDKFDDLRPLLLQTPASGPTGECSKAPPYFRRVKINDGGQIITAKVENLPKPKPPKPAKLDPVAILPEVTLDAIVPPYPHYNYFNGAEKYPFSHHAIAFDMVKAWWLIEASTLAYAEEDFASPLFKKAGFTDVKFLSGNGTQCFVVHNKDFAIIAFRGTELRRLKGKSDWQNVTADLKTDAKFMLTGWDSGGKVHLGFKKALDDVWKELLEYIVENISNHEIWFTGHSLGGAIATLAASRYARHGNVQGLYTFGSPRVGNAAFANKFTDKFKRIAYRFVNNNDIVATVPFLPYEHVGELKYIDYRGIVQNSPSNGEWRTEVRIRRWFAYLIPNSVIDHVPTLYATHIWNNIP